MSVLPSSRHVWFVGVTTSQSAINALFPVWARELGLDADLTGLDLPLDATPDMYRSLIDEMRLADGFIGAVITSHKVRLLAAAHDQFVDLQPVARVLGEVNSVALRSDGLYGAATDGAAIRKTLDEMLEPRYFDQTGAEAVCFGVGGSARAFGLALLCEFGASSPPFGLRADAPKLLHAVGRRAESLAEFASVMNAAGIPESRLSLHLNVSPADNDALTTRLPEGSLIVNATGLGKDTPGSPVTSRAVFPRGSVAWDFNYRGGLDFLVNAAEQRATRDVQVHDGWPYFLHGWTEALAPVLGTALEHATFSRLARAAAPFRPSSAGWGGDQGKEAR